MPNSETRICQNCKASFEIDASDFQFYERIQVPPPTQCPECRFISRMIWRNEYILNRRTDDHDGKKIFSTFSDASPVKVYEKSFWQSDGWDAGDYGRDYDWSKPFFTQIKDLLKEAPLPSVSIIEGENNQYCMNYGRLKNCYLCFAGSDSEDCAYVIWSNRAKHSFDSHMLYNSELCYGDLNVDKSYRTHLSVNCESCQNVIFCKNCIGCTGCFGCANLRNKSYCILNKQYSKEHYYEEIGKLNFGSHASLNQIRDRVYDFWLSQPVKYMTGRNNLNATGEYINNSKNSFYCYRVREAENVKYCQNIINPTAKDCFDYTNWGENVELMYCDLQCGENSYDVQFSVSSFPANRSIRYCIFCANSSNLFGCVGMRNKQHCILNKQYAKEEYENLVPKIIRHMKDVPFRDGLGRTYSFGDFFPPALSYFAYNETPAQEFFPLTKDQALAQGYRWRNPEPRDYEIHLKSEDLSDHIKDVKDDILGKHIQCAHYSNDRDDDNDNNRDNDYDNDNDAKKSSSMSSSSCNHQCTTAFKIIPQELAFYRKMNLPLPRLCPNCRHHQRLKQRNPPKLWHRRCHCAGRKSDPPTGGRNSESETVEYENTAPHFHGENPCPNEFETSYPPRLAGSSGEAGAPERQEIVYCEQCYNAEVV